MSMNIFYLFLLFFVSANNILFAGNNNITPLDVAVESALHKIKKISSDIEIINKSLDTYIPVSCEKNKYISLSKEELQQQVNNGLTAYKTKFKGIEREG